MFIRFIKLVLYIVGLILLSPVICFLIFLFLFSVPICYIVKDDAFYFLNVISEYIDKLIIKYC